MQNIKTSNELQNCVKAKYKNLEIQKLLFLNFLLSMKKLTEIAKLTIND